MFKNYIQLMTFDASDRNLQANHSFSFCIVDAITDIWCCWQRALCNQVNYIGSINHSPVHVTLKSSTTNCNAKSIQAHYLFGQTPRNKSMFHVSFNNCTGPNAVN